MKRIVLILIIFTTFFTISAYGQQISFTSYTSAQGLSQNSGYCITQDAKGYIWMGTQDGLNRFNGRKITTYYKETVTRGSLTGNHITSLFFDSLHNWLWIGTESGLTIYDITVDSFYRSSHYFPQADTLGGLMIGNITKVAENKIAVCTFSEGIFICNTNTREVKQYLNQPGVKNRTRAAALWNNTLFAIAAGKLYKLSDTAQMLLPGTDMGDVRNMLVWQNSLWVASANTGLYKITDSNNPVPSLFKCGSNAIGVLATDNMDNLWIGSRDKGLIIIEPKTFSVLHSFEMAGNQNEWPKKFTLSLFKDRQNTIWAGSSSGGFTACCMAEKPFGLIQKTEQNGKAAHNMILSLYGPVNNILYTGTQLEGLRLYNMATKELNYYTVGKSSGNAIMNITASSLTDTWLATAQGLYHFNNSTKKVTHYIDSSFVSSLGGLFIIKLNNHDSLLYSNGRGIVLFDTRNKKFRFPDLANNNRLMNLVPYSALQDSIGNIWMVCEGYGLIHYSFASKAFKVIEKVKAVSGNIYDIRSRDGIFWMTGANGLIIYNPKKDSIIKILNTANGLPGNVLYSLELGSDDNFWGAGNRGLVKINPGTFSIIVIPASAGLQSDEFNKTCSAKDSSGNLFFGGINGVSFFNPSRLSVSMFSPSPTIESVKISNKEISLSKNILYTDEINLSHDQNFITFEFGVPNYTNNNGCSFKYKLEGINTDWVLNGTRNYITFTNLSPGTYTLLLQSANSGGIWCKEITKLKINIAPAWWQTIFFYLSCCMLAILLLSFIIRRRIQHIRKAATIKQHITETEIAALKAQMNPHFIFNCINSIDAFIHSNDKYNATLYLNKFAKLLRNILDSSKQNVVVFTKDVETLKLYIELEELRHENKFKPTISIDDELLSNDYKVPPLIIQPFVENAILHGLKNREDNEGLLQITIKKVADKIEYTIKDNGIGRKAAGMIAQNKETSYGMQMSYDRVKLFNKEDKPSVQIIDLYKDDVATGTEVKVSLNII